MRIVRRSLDMFVLLFLLIFCSAYTAYYFPSIILSLLPYLIMVGGYMIYIILDREGIVNKDQNKVGNGNFNKTKHKMVEETSLNQDPIPIWFYQRKDKPRGKVYSNILMRNVDLCCYQGARLNDRYCICGRGIIYPKITENKVY